jgi:phytoene dehydrogenase-like protein
MNYDVIIIGGGHNGLVASFYLARAGMRVLVLEARPILGGCCVTEELIPGFRFSTCANLVWALRPEIIRDMGLEQRGLIVDSRTFVRLQPDGQYLFSGKNLVTATPGAGLAAVQKEVAKFSVADAAALPRWQEFVGRLARIFGPSLMRPPPRLHEIYAACVDDEDRKALDAILTKSVAQLADDFFESDLMRDVGVSADMGDAHALGTGLLLALSTAMGAYTSTDRPVPNGYVRGGMGRISDTMVEAAKEQGVEFRTGTPVKRIRVEQGVTTGVELVSGEKIAARFVVSNVDPKQTFLKLVAPEDLDPKFLGRVRGLQSHSAAGLKMHCALSEMLDYKIAPGLTAAQLRESTLIISPNRAYRQAAWHAASQGELPEKPVIGGFIPSVYDPSLAPPGKFTFSMYLTWAPAKPRRGTWAERKAEMAENVIRVMEQHTTNFRRALSDFVLFTPDELETRNYLTDGNIHHLDATPTQILWQRPLPEIANYRGPVSGMYLCGSGSHPWGEVCGAPGHNAAQAILQDWKKR